MAPTDLKDGPAPLSIRESWRARFVRFWLKRQQPPPLVGYRLTGWPRLEPEQRKADVLGALSVMTSRMVTVHWLAHRLRWPVHKAGAFLDDLVIHGLAVRVIPRSGEDDTG